MLSRKAGGRDTRIDLVSKRRSDTQNDWTRANVSPRASLGRRTQSKKDVTSADLADKKLTQSAGSTPESMDDFGSEKEKKQNGNGNGTVLVGGVVGVGVVGVGVVGDENGEDSNDSATATPTPQHRKMAERRLTTQLDAYELMKLKAELAEFEEEEIQRRRPSLHLNLQAAAIGGSALLLLL